MWIKRIYQGAGFILGAALAIGFLWFSTPIAILTSLTLFLSIASVMLFAGLGLLAGDSLFHFIYDIQPCGYVPVSKGIIGNILTLPEKHFPVIHDIFKDFVSVPDFIIAHAHDPIHSGSYGAKNGNPYLEKPVENERRSLVMTQEPSGSDIRLTN